MSKAQIFLHRFHQNKNTDNFCILSLRNKIIEAAASFGPWGGDDIMYWFSDGSMLLDRIIVKELQLFKS